MNYVVYDDVINYLNNNKEELVEKFKLIYLDPPYNSKRSRGARKNYSDNNKNWVDFMEEVIQNAYSVLRNDGFIVFSINQTELFRLKNVADKVFTTDCFVGVFPVKIRHQERQLMINATFHDVYEYLLIYRKNKTTRFNTVFKTADLSKFVHRIEILDENCETRNINGKIVEIYRPGQYRVVKDEPSEGALRRYIIAGKLKTANWSGEWYETHLKNIEVENQLLFKVYGLENEGLGYRWFESGGSKRESGVYFQSTLTAGRPILPTNDLDFTEEVTTIYKEGGPGCDYKDSKKPEKLIGWILDICTAENDEVLDLFGGSGTTIATCIKKRRKCTIVENSEVAIDVIKNRLQNLTRGLDIDNIVYEFNYEEIININEGNKYA